MRVTVMGTGGTGGYFGGLLARAGEDVTFVARGAHLDAIRANGLTVRSRLSGTFTVPARATDNPGEAGPAELVLFCVKAYDTERAAESLGAAVGPGTVILPVQNGIDSAERIGRVVGSDHVIGGLAGVSSVIAEPGVIEHRAGPDLVQLGELDEKPSARTSRIAETLGRAGMKVQVRTDIRVALWEKFVLICGLSGLTALTRLPIGAVLACQETRTLLRQVMEETATVGRAEAPALSEGIVDNLLKLFGASDPALRGSLYYDLAAGRRLEIETLNGTVVRIGRERGIATPANFVVYASLKPYADGAPAVTGSPA